MNNRLHELVHRQAWQSSTFQLNAASTQRCIIQSHETTYTHVRRTLQILHKLRNNKTMTAINKQEHCYSKVTERQGDH